MTDTQYEPIDEPAPHAQVNKVRGEYVDGEMSEAELEVQLENSLSEGPSLCSQVVGEKDWGTRDRLSSYAQAAVLIPFALVADWKMGDDRDVKYYPRRHMWAGVDHDPDPDDHPAQSAGGIRSLLGMLSMWVYCYLALLTVGISPIAGLSLTALFTLCAIGPRPTVRHTDVGVGTHVAD